MCLPVTAWANPTTYIGAGIPAPRRIDGLEQDAANQARSAVWFHEHQLSSRRLAGKHLYTAAFGDIDGDGLPGRRDSHVPGVGGLDVKIYLNKNGRFDAQPDHVIHCPNLVPAPNSASIISSPGKVADLLVGTDNDAALLLADSGKRSWHVAPNSRRRSRGELCRGSQHTAATMHHRPAIQRGMYSLPASSPTARSKPAAAPSSLAPQWNYN